MQEKTNRGEAAYQAARKQIEDEWRREGMTDADLERSKRIADSLDTLAGAGFDVSVLFASEAITDRLTRLETLSPTVEARLSALESRLQTPGNFQGQSEAA